jgi:hypothetical protein
MHMFRYNRKKHMHYERGKNVSFLLGWEWLGKDEKNR